MVRFRQTCVRRQTVFRRREEKTECVCTVEECLLEAIWYEFLGGEADSEL